MGMIKFSPGRCCCDSNYICSYYEGQVCPGDDALEEISGTWSCTAGVWPLTATGTYRHIIISGAEWLDEYDTPDCSYGLYYRIVFVISDNTRVLFCLDPGDGTGTKRCFECGVDAGQGWYGIVDYDFDTNTRTEIVRLNRDIIGGPTYDMDFYIQRDLDWHDLIPPDSTEDISCVTDCAGNDIEIVLYDGYQILPDNGTFDTTYIQFDVVRRIDFTPTDGDPVKIGIFAESIVGGAFTFELDELIISGRRFRKSLSGVRECPTAVAECVDGDVSLADCFDELHFESCYALVHTPEVVAVDFGIGGWTGGSGFTPGDDDTAIACPDVAGEFVIFGSDNFIACFPDTTDCTAQEYPCDGPPAVDVNPVCVTVHRSTETECNECSWFEEYNLSVNDISPPIKLQLGVHFWKDGADYICDIYAYVVFPNVFSGYSYLAPSAVRYQATSATKWLFDSNSPITLTKIEEVHNTSRLWTSPPGEDCENEFTICDGELPETITLRGIYEQ